MFVKSLCVCVCVASVHVFTIVGSYLTAAAANFAKSRGQPVKSAMGLFNGIFFAIFQCSAAVGMPVSFIHYY